MNTASRKFEPFKNWLQQVSFLTPYDCGMFEHSLELMHVKSKTLWLEEGKVCGEMGFVQRGCFRVYYLQDGKEINIQFITENQFVVDYHSFISKEVSRYFIEAMEDAELVIFPYSALQQAYAESKNWERFGRMMAEAAFRHTTNRVESFLFMDAEQRYELFMREHPDLLNRLPLYHIASYLGIERESLSRLRKKIAGK